MAIPSGLHIGTEDAVILTWNGAAIANTLNFAANFGVPANKHVTCLASVGSLFAGTESVAELWEYNGGWSQIVDATAANITTVHDVCVWDNFVFCCASDTLGGAGAAGTEIWRWDYIAAGAAPTAALASIGGGFVGTNLAVFANTYLVCGGYVSGAPAIYYSQDFGASWTSAKCPLPYNVTNGSVVSMVELSGYLYAVVSEGSPAANLNVFRSSDLETWEKSAEYSTFVPSQKGAISFGSELFIGGAPSTGATATEYYHFDGTSWEKVEAHATARVPRGFAYYTDGSASTPTLWMIADDDLLSYASATEAWTAEDSGATTDYISVRGALEPSTTPTWRIPSTGAGVNTTTQLMVEGTGLTTDIRVYKDSVVDTTNWTIHYDMDWTDGKLKFYLSRDAALSTTTLSTIDIYVYGQDTTWYVVRTAYYGVVAATASTAGIKKGEAVKHLSDGNQYYVRGVKDVTDTTRSLYLVGSGTYGDTWVSSSNVIRVTSGPMFSGMELELGPPAASPP